MTKIEHYNEFYTPSVRHWTRNEDQVQAITDNVSLTATLKCSGSKKISALEFASFGNPIDACLGKAECVIPVNKSTFQQEKKDSWKNVVKTLAVQVKCRGGKKN